MQMAKSFKLFNQFQSKVRINKILGYIILYCGSLILLSKFFIAIL